MISLLFFLLFFTQDKVFLKEFEGNWVIKEKYEHIVIEVVFQEEDKPSRLSGITTVSEREPKYFFYICDRTGKCLNKEVSKKDFEKFTIGQKYNIKSKKRQ